jgi:hypothetical protein
LRSTSTKEVMQRASHPIHGTGVMCGAKRVHPQQCLEPTPSPSLCNAFERSIAGRGVDLGCYSAEKPRCSRSGGPPGLDPVLLMRVRQRSHAQGTTVRLVSTAPLPRYHHRVGACGRRQCAVPFGDTMQRFAEAPGGLVYRTRATGVHRTEDRRGAAGHPLPGSVERESLGREMIPNARGKVASMDACDLVAARTHPMR